MGASVANAHRCWSRLHYQGWSETLRLLLFVLIISGVDGIESFKRESRAIPPAIPNFVRAATTPTTDLPLAVHTCGSSVGWEDTCSPPQNTGQEGEFPTIPKSLLPSTYAQSHVAVSFCDKRVIYSSVTAGVMRWHQSVIARSYRCIKASMLNTPELR